MMTSLLRVSGASLRTAAVVTVAMWSTACNTAGPAGPLTREHQAVERGAAMRARVDVNMTAGDLSVQAGAVQLFEGDFEFNVPALKPTVAYAVDGGTGVLTVSQGSASGNYQNNWHLNLDEATPIELHVNLGAGDAKLTLGRLNLQSVAIGLGAGDLVLDLRGMPASSYPVSVNAGAGDTTIQVPASAGISVRTLGLIGDATVNGLEKRDDRWINPRATASPVHIDIRVQHAIGDLTLTAE